MSNVHLEYLNNYAETIAEVAANIRKHGEAFTVEDGERYEYEPLEVVAEIGRPWTVLLTYGGPNVSLSADGFGPVTLDLYWGGAHHYKWDNNGDFATVLDYFTGRDS